MNKSGRASPKLLKQLSNNSNKVEQFIKNISLPSNTTLRQRKVGLKHLKKQMGKLEKRDRKRKTRPFRMNLTKHKNKVRAHNTAQQLAAAGEGGLITVSTSPTRKIIGQPKLKMEGGGDGAFDMPLDEETGSGTGNMQKSLKSQGSRNQLGGFATSFIPAPGVPGSDVSKMKFLGDNAVQSWADSEMDGNVKNLEKPCNRGGGKSRSKKKRRRKSRKRTKKRKRKRKTKRKGGRRSRRRKRRKSRPQLRFSKMPPLYL
jgi:hypothetical protein